MASTTASRPPALMPVSIRMGENTVDMSVPTNVALAEFTPNIVSQITQLSASSASQGYRITNSQGKVLDQSQTLINQGIQAGSVLILSKIGDSTQDLRYDDLVEAVGTAVENDQAPWNSDNSVDLSTHASALLVLTAAVLIFTGGRGSTMGLIVGLSGAVLASLACAVIARSSSRLAPLSLAHSIPILAGAAVMSAIPGSWSGLPLAGFGIAAILSASVLLAILPKALRGSITAPLTYGFSATAIGLLTGFAHLSTQRAASAVYTLLIVLILIAPWFAMARIPVRVTGIQETIDPYEVVHKVHEGYILTISLKTGASLGSLICIPLLLDTRYSLLLLICAGVALLLSTRSLRSRTEVLIGALLGIILLLSGAIGSAILMPQALIPVVLLLFVATGLVLALTVIDPKMRPWVTRIADALSLVSMLALVPIATLVWGVL